MAIVKTDSQYYADIAAAIRSKSGSTARYQPREMSGAILSLETGSQGSVILVYAPTGASVTLTCGETVRTAPEDNGVWRFDNCGPGTWQVAASKEDMQEIYNLEITEKGQLLRYEVYLTLGKVYGIQRNITNNSPVWTRTDDAVGLTATGSVGTSAGSSDFDTIYPWREIRRETFSTGDVMVRIPKFWYRRYMEGNVEYIKIATAAKEGFALHPAFCHGGIQRDAIYVAAYKTSSGNLSVSGSMPRTNQGIAACRSLAVGKGPGWGLLDMSTTSAIQMLFLVEFANSNSQEVLGDGYCGKTASDPYIATGSTDNVPNLTGRPAGVRDEVDVIYRGMEALWGNVYDMVDGAIIDGSNKKFYVCNDPSQYGEAITSAYTGLDWSIPGTSYVGKFVTRMGYQQGQWDYVMLPLEANAGSATTYYCDFAYFSPSGLRSLRRGGRWNSGNEAGLFTYDASLISPSSDNKDGSRLIYIPQEVSA